MSDDYAFQLAQVEEALHKDPLNLDLQRLRDDLKDLMALMALEQPAAAAPVSGRKRPHDHTDSAAAPDDSDGGTSGFGDNAIAAGVPSRWIVGQTVLAKYARDSKMYEAVVDAVPTSSNPFYFVVFKGYTSKEKVAPADVRDFDPTQVAKPIAAVTGGAANKRKTVPKAVVAAFSNGTDRASKRKQRNLEYQEAVKAKEIDQSQKQNAWQSFATGGKKASLKTTAPLKKTSMFSTPDDPAAKVGVVGSGKGMTQFQQRGKHVYDRLD
ncbi:hypothetical protein HDU83_007875 [Entophlyctis luteolus]|nr:hypothetical protein HDU82_008046 [Entophlyctis luteolus]KAJ3352568.1 hypothetical protein HDU83_007875 [Entophlyctis luteolus]KAJ3385149.1 hypothetical protein HDU84_002427 [Entophlyctis sp. JEL0112]